jgi:hypothetical protein
MPIQVQEASGTPKRHDKSYTSPWHIIVKIIRTKNKKKVLKVVGDKNQITYKGKLIKITADFSEKEGHGVRNLQHRKKTTLALVFCPKKLSFKIEGEITKSKQTKQHDTQKLKQYMNTKLPLQKILKEILHTEDEKEHSHERMGIIKPQEKTR